MSLNEKRLGDAELEIMQAIWCSDEAVNSTYILAALKGKRNWSPGALGTALSRLCEKGFLFCEKRGWNNFYTPLITHAAYQQSEGRSILEKLYGNSVTGLVASLVDGRSVSAQDLRELREMLERWEETP